MNTISFIGSGNVAFRMALAFQEKGFYVPYIWDRTAEKGAKLVRVLNSNLEASTARNAYYSGMMNPVPTGTPTLAATSLTDLLESDMIVVAVSDDAIPQVVESLSHEIHNAVKCGLEHLPVIVHTSGATDINVLDILEKEGCRCGVLYPMQTLSKSKIVDFKYVPFLLEANHDETLNALRELCNVLDSEFLCCDSQERLMMHIAAVFACNFTNYILTLAFEISGKMHTMLLPTTIEMVRKSFLQSPGIALTGPAKRGDMKTIEKHIKALKDAGMAEHSEIYRILTDQLLQRNKHE